MDPTLSAVLRSWEWRSDVVAVVVALAGAYITGWRRLRCRRPEAAPGWRLALYLAGLASIVLALLSPIDTIGGLLFWVHMVQHEFLTMLAPPLLLLGNPVPVILWGLPPTLRRWLSGALAPGRWLRRALRILTFMPLTWPLYVFSLWAWHWPPAYEASLRSSLVHDVQHLMFFGTALLFWWPIIQPAPRVRAHVHHAWRVVYVIPAAMQSQALGLIFAFLGRSLYPHYQAVPRLWGYTPVSDQSAAGLLMMQVEGLTYLLVVLLLVAGLLNYEERMTRIREEHGTEV